MFIFRSTQILRFLIAAAIRKPKLIAAIALAMLAALAGTLTYSGFLVVGVVAGYLDTGRFLAGLLLGFLLARFPWMSKGKLRIVGLLPKPVRRPFITGLVALCVLHFVWWGEFVAAAFTGFTTAFLLTFPWLRRTVFDRMRSSVFKFAGRNPVKHSDDDMVIDGEFIERKD